MSAGYWHGDYWHANYWALSGNYWAAAGTSTVVSVGAEWTLPDGVAAFSLPRERAEMTLPDGLAQWGLPDDN